MTQLSTFFSAEGRFPSLAVKVSLLWGMMITKIWERLTDKQHCFSHERQERRQGRDIFQKFIACCIKKRVFLLCFKLLLVSMSVPVSGVVESGEIWWILHLFTIFLILGADKRKAHIYVSRAQWGKAPKSHCFQDVLKYLLKWLTYLRSWCKRMHF